MSNLFATFAVILSLTAAQAYAENHEYKNTPQYQQMEKDTREALKNCLNDENIKTKNCIEKYKDTRKAQKKEIKKMYKKQRNN